MAIFPESAAAEPFAPSDASSRADDDAAALRKRFADCDAETLLGTLITEVFPGRICVVSSFGTESALLLALVAEVDRAVPVIFLDTGKHFPETLTYRDRLVRRLGLTDLRVLTPEPANLLRHDPRGDLWQRQPDRCCQLRKVLPLAPALAPFAAWISGLKRYHGDTRARVERIESDGGRIKVNPLADWPENRVKAAYGARGLPQHPLIFQGFHSIGCAPCTAPVEPGQAPRAGRWAGSAKTECGIHLPRQEPL